MTTPAEQIAPKTRVPFLLGVAILVSFFPCGILYPLSYPVREIATLLLWICAFPSAAGLLSLPLLPLLPNNTYGYFAFNLFCVLGTLGTAMRVTRWGEAHHVLSARLHHLSRICMLISLVLAAWQALDGDAWLRMFPAMSSIGDGRGGGLRPEPSLLAPPLAIYLTFVLWRRLQMPAVEGGHGKLFAEAGSIGLATVFLTRSLTVSIILLCFLPAFTVRLKYFVTAGAAGALLAGAVFWDRLRDAFSSAKTVTYLITAAVGSWRNVPDIVILVNMRDYLLPSNPADLREKLNLLATLWSPVFFWLDNTYSSFSASASTIGVIATAGLFGAGLFLGLRKISCETPMRMTWVMLYIVNWFILPKYEPCGWVALGLLTAAAPLSEEKVSEIVAAYAIAKASP